MNRGRTPVRFGCALWFIFLAIHPLRGAPPLNDDFADRIPLSGTRVTTTGTLLGSTRQPDEPGAEPGALAPARLHSVWWSWTAPADGLLMVSVRVSEVPSLVEIFTGNTLGGLQTVPNARPFVLGRRPALAVHVSAGTNYQFAVDGAEPSGNLVLKLAFFPRPANDNFTSRIDLGTNDTTVTGINTGATREPDEPQVLEDASIWWSWTAPVDGPVTISVEQSPLDPEAGDFAVYPEYALLGVFTGNSLGEAGIVTSKFGSRELNGWGPAQVTFEAHAGTAYQIAVDGGREAFSSLTLRIAHNLPPMVILTDPFSEASHIEGTPVTISAQAFDPDGTVASVEFLVGSWQAGAEYLGKHLAQTKPFRTPALQLRPGVYEAFARATDNRGAQADAVPIVINVRPRNDSFAQRTHFTGSSVTVTGTLANATYEADEPGGVGSALIWWSWTAPSSGKFTITADSEPGYYPSLLGLTGDALTNLNFIAGSTFPGFNTYSARVVLEAQAGTTYSLAVATFGFGGWCTLSVQKSTPPTVTFTSPAAGTRITFGQSLTFEVDAQDDGTVQRVDYMLNDSVLLGSATTPPFSLTVPFTDTWGPVRAWAFDDSGLATASELFWFEVTLPGPANDSFAGRALLTGSFLSVTASTAYATFETGEPSTVGGGSAWWAWTAPATGRFAVTVHSDAFFPPLAIFTGSDLAGLQMVANNTDAGWDEAHDTQVVFDAVAGVTYPIAIGAGGDIVLSIRQTLPPSVHITSPLPDSTYFVGMPVTLAASAFDSDGPIAKVEFYLDGQLLTAMTNPPFSVSISSTNLNGTYRLKARAIDNAGVTSFSDAVAFTVVHPGPVNDDFANRIAFTGATTTVTGTTDYATFEAAEFHATWQATAWWSWTAPASGFYTITAQGSPGYPTDLAVFTGPALFVLSLVTNTSTFGVPATLPIRVVFEAVAGVAYHLSAGGGDIVLTVVPSSPPEVQIVAPLSGSGFYTGQPVTFEVAASDSDGAVQRVEYELDDSVLLGSVTNAPFSLVQTFDSGGALHHVRAWAIDSAGLRTPSEVVWFQIDDPPAANDAFAHRIVLSGYLAVTTGNMHNATLEEGEPDPKADFVVGSVWYSWTAPLSGVVTLFGEYGAGLAVYQGSRVDALETVGYVPPNLSSRMTRLVFTARVGTDYKISLLGGGPARLNLFLDARDLRPPRFLPNGQLALELHTTMERNWLVESSTNLLNWVPVGIQPSSEGTLEFFEPISLNTPYKIYRAREVP